MFSPTPYPDINAVLQKLLSSVQGALGTYFTGMIVHGSLANGDFNPHCSDIDVLVVTTVELPPGMLPALRAMHAALTSSGMPWAAEMEVSYIPQRALRRFDPANCNHPALRIDGSFEVDGHDAGWIIQRHIIREKGLVVAGPAPQTLIDPVTPGELRGAQIELLREWWAPQLRDPALLRSSEYQAYAVLTMCRALYTLQYGAVTTKPGAARWAQQILGEPWAALIQRAAAWRRGMPMDDLPGVLDFIRYTLARGEESTALERLQR
ncbi:MAG TPA: aminoglycoside adenylyltransferase domain-containing protein [Anaerolineae bacterium]